MVTPRRPKTIPGAALPPVAPSPSPSPLPSPSQRRSTILYHTHFDSSHEQPLHADNFSVEPCTNQAMSPVNVSLSSKLISLPISRQAPPHAYPPDPQYCQPSLSEHAVSASVAQYPSVGVGAQTSIPLQSDTYASTTAGSSLSGTQRLCSEHATPNSNSRRGRRPTSWTAEEDIRLAELVAAEAQAPPSMSSTKTWSIIASQLPSRTGKQCRERWLNQLKPGIKREPWSAEEERTLYEAHARLGNRWVAIAELLPGRTDNCIKNHYNSMLRKQMRRKASAAMLEQLDCVETPRRLITGRGACAADRSHELNVDRDTPSTNSCDSSEHDMMSISMSRSPPPSAPTTPTAAFSGKSSSSAGASTLMLHTPRNAKLEICNLVTNSGTSEDVAQEKSSQLSTGRASGNHSHVDANVAANTAMTSLGLSNCASHGQNGCYSCVTKTESRNYRREYLDWGCSPLGHLHEDTLQSRHAAHAAEYQSTRGIPVSACANIVPVPHGRGYSPSLAASTPSSSMPSSACPSPLTTQVSRRTQADVFQQNHAERQNICRDQMVTYLADEELASVAMSPAVLGPSYGESLNKEVIVVASEDTTCRAPSTSSESESIRSRRGITKKRHSSSTAALAALAMAASAVPPSPLTPEPRSVRSPSSLPP